ncbi:DUF6049 family protein [Xylanimonas ulmi]|uniref:Glycoprotein n=1 Tax=Xylanimonas ulmi TaxID=228973 RepID=A0A4Q7M3V3_9MICO|nr:DUF6049 family protein [Xylanibacterium ulmi]RZS62625.1 hypothetical protein EV386_2967 [Xylanibacterium ulmi]
MTRLLTLRRAPGARRPPARPAARARAARLAVAALVGATLGVLGAGAAPATAATTSPATTSTTNPATTSPATTSPATTARIALTSLTPAVARPGDDLTVTVRVTNQTAQPLDGANLELWAGWKRIVAREDLSAWANDVSPGPRQPQKRVPVEPVAPGQSVEVSLTIGIDGLGLDGATRGPRQLALTLRQDGGSVDVIRTFLLWDPDAADEDGADADPVRLSLLAPMTGPAVDPSDPQATGALAGSAAPGGALARTLAAVSAAEQATGARGALSLAIDPALVATAAASDDPQVAAWAGAVSELGDRTGVRPLAPYDPDLAALAHASLDPSALTAAVTAPLPGGWTMPDTWGDPLAWPAGSAAPDLATLGAARAAGLGTAVVASGLAPIRGTGTGLATVATGHGDITAVVADGPLSTVLYSATHRTNGQTTGETTGQTNGQANGHANGAVALSTTEATQRLLAETSVVSAQSADNEPHLVAVMPRGWSPDLDALRGTLSALAASGWVRLTPLDDLLSEPTPDITRVPLDSSEPQAQELAPDQVRRLEQARAAVASLASVAAQPSDLTALVGPQLAAPTSVAWRASPEARPAAVSAAVSAADALRGRLAVSVVDTEITLISAAGSLPVSVRNDLPVDATVTVMLEPDDPRLVVGARPTQTIAAGAEARITVPVSALASGDVEVEVRLLTPDGAPAAAPVTLQLRVRAGWETVGTAVIAGGVALLLIVGIWRTVRRGRSPRRATDAHVPDPLIPAEASRRTDKRT